jgi:hypothetical protein
LGDTLSGSDVFAKYPKMGYTNVKETPNYSYYDPNTGSIGIRESSKQKISPLLHEVQHAIQNAENWPGGGRPSRMIFDDYPPDIKKRINEYLSVLNENPHVQSSIDNLHKKGKIEAYYNLTGESQARATQDRLDMDMQQRRDNYPLAGDRLGATPLDDLINKYTDDVPFAKGGHVDKDSMELNKPHRTPNHPTKSHIVKTMVDGKETIIRFGEQGAETAGKPKEGESDRMKAKRDSFKARHAKNIAKGPSSAAYWANKVKWNEGGSVEYNPIKIDQIIDATHKELGTGRYADGGSVNTTLKLG